MYGTEPSRLPINEVIPYIIGVCFIFPKIYIFDNPGKFPSQSTGILTIKLKEIHI